MDVQKELEKWKTEFTSAESAEAKDDHRRRFKLFLQLLAPEDGKAFAEAFQGGIKSIGETKELIKNIEIRQKK